MRRRAGEGIDPGNEVVDGSHLYTSGAHFHILRPLEPGIAQDDRFAVRAAVAQVPLPGALHWTEITLDQLANHLIWRQRVRERVVAAIPCPTSLDVTDVD